MNQKFEKSLTIVVVGSMHHDFTIYPIYEKLFRNLHKNKIPVGLLKEEIPPEDTLIQTKKLTDMALKKSRIFSKQIVGSNNIYEHDIHGRHVSISGYLILTHLLHTKLHKPHQPGLVEQLALEVCRENAYEKELDLYRLMSQLDLYFSGIEMAKEEYLPRALAAAASYEALRNNEPLRIQALLTNAFKSIISNFLSGGVVFISTGTRHAHRLGANIIQHLKTHPLPIKVDVQVFEYYSHYCEYFRQLVEKGEQLANLDSVDSIDIKNIYQSLPCQTITGAWNGTCFTAPELEQLIDQKIINYTPPIAAATTFSMFKKIKSIPTAEKWVLAGTVFTLAMGYLLGSQVLTMGTFALNLAKYGYEKYQQDQASDACLQA